MSEPFYQLTRCPLVHQPRWRRLSVGLTACLIALFLYPAAASAQEAGTTATQGDDAATLWQDADPGEIIVSAAVGDGRAPRNYRLLRSNANALNAVLDQAPKTEVGMGLKSSTITLPLPDGSFQRFWVEEYQMLEPAMAEQFPAYRTYMGWGIDDPAAKIALSRTPSGFYGMILTEADTIFIDPQSLEGYVISYSKRDLPRQFWFDNHDHADSISAAAITVPDAPVATGDKLRIYRLAIAATAEYTASQGGKERARESIVTFVSRLNAIYRRDLSVQFELVNNDTIIYEGRSPYTNSDERAMLAENQTNLDRVIGSANYDIGHVFATSGGGVANLQSLCSAGSKAKGAGPPGIALHEIGHQLNADHTFNAQTAANCNAGNFSTNNVSNYEPGSGSTIMSYVGICGSQNLQDQRDDYLHAISIQEMTTYVNSVTCGRIVNTGNAIPQVNAGPDRNIPAGTRFTLSGQATDGDGDALTYTWEQFQASAPWTNANQLPNTDLGNNTIFRSYPPTADNFRDFPSLKPEQAALAARGESLPTTDRTLSFRLTARDSKGGVNADDVNVKVVNTAGPFVITAPQAGTLWDPGSQQTVTWNVANTDQAPLSCTSVDIMGSSDGGKNFTMLAQGTPNDGSEAVTVPNQIGGLIVKVACTSNNNIFFALTQAPGVQLCSAVLNDNHEDGQAGWTAAGGDTGWVFRTDGGFSGNNYWFVGSFEFGTSTLDSQVATATSDNLTLIFQHKFRFLNDSQVGTIQIKVNNGNFTDLKTFAISSENYPDSYIAERIDLSSVVKKDDTFQLRFRRAAANGRISGRDSDGWSLDDILVCGSGTTAPPPPPPTAGSATWTGATSTDWNTAGNWNTNQVPNATTDVRIPTGLTNYPAVAGDIVARNVVIDTGGQINMTSGIFAVHGSWGSQAATVNAAGINATESFCKDYTNELNPDPNIPVISEQAVVTDTIQIGSGGRLVDLDVLLEATHTYVGDIVMTLKHNTSDTEINLFDANNPNCSGDNFNLTLDDEAGDALTGACTGNTPAFPGNRYQPIGTLSAFDGKAFGGLWTLTIRDRAQGDQGQLRKWCLNVTSEENTPIGGTGGSFNGTGGTVLFKGTTQTFRPAANSTFNNVQIGDGTVASQVSLQGDVDINGNLTIGQGAKLSGGSATIKLAGNWSQSDTEAFNAEQGAISFDGTTQSINGSLSGNNITVNAGSTVDVGQNDLTASGKLVNEGAMKQTKSIAADATASFFGTGGYGGLTIQAFTTALESTTVTIRKATTGCTGTPGHTIQRCYRVEPAVTTGVDVVMRFFYDQGEQLSNSCTQMKAYPDDGSNGPLTPLETFGTNCDGALRSLDIFAVNSFAIKDFVLGENVGNGGARDNEPPAATADTVTTTVATAVEIDILANDFDPEGGPVLLEEAGLGQPQNGTVTVTGKNRILYTPADGFSGTDSFTYEIADENDNRATGTITVVVAATQQRLFLPIVIR